MAEIEMLERPGEEAELLGESQSAKVPSTAMTTKW
jgi:hypothetical protein